MVESVTVEESIDTLLEDADEHHQGDITFDGDKVFVEWDIDGQRYVETYENSKTELFLE